MPIKGSLQQHNHHTTKYTCCSIVLQPFRDARFIFFILPTTTSDVWRTQKSIRLSAQTPPAYQTARYTARAPARSGDCGSLSVPPIPRVAQGSCRSSTAPLLRAEAAPRLCWEPLRQRTRQRAGRRWSKRNSDG